MFKLELKKLDDLDKGQFEMNHNAMWTQVEMSGKHSPGQIAHHTSVVNIDTARSLVESNATVL